MPKARKLPSGRWRIQVFSHTEKIIDPETGKIVKKDRYIYLTSQDPTLAGKRELERRAAEFQSQSPSARKKAAERGDMTIADALDAYIEDCKARHLSPTTLRDYQITREHGFQALMPIKLKSITEEVLQAAINSETEHKTKRTKKGISAKRLKNQFVPIKAALKKYHPGINFDALVFPTVKKRIPKLPTPEQVYKIVRGTSIELPVLLAMWLSFSESEIRGLTKSGSISADGNYITINEVVVDVGKETVRKSEAKNPYRKRMHKIPERLKSLINQVDGDVIVPLSGSTIYHRWQRAQELAGWENKITFHDLRHISASVMALLHVPDVYAQERGGWASNRIMKGVYTQTFTPERVRIDAEIDKYFEQILSK